MLPLYQELKKSEVRVTAIERTDMHYTYETLQKHDEPQLSHFQVAKHLHIE